MRTSVKLFCCVGSRVNIPPINTVDALIQTTKNEKLKFSRFGASSYERLLSYDFLVIVKFSEFIFFLRKKFLEKEQSSM
jgi:hypothetical protein